jgi:putative flippase GtrA
MFAAVGLVAFAVDTGVFTGLKTTVLAPAPVAAKLVAVLTATVVGYLLNQRWTFRTRSRRRRGHEVLLYV